MIAGVHQILDPACRQVPDSCGAIDDGMAWYHARQARVEVGRWPTVALTGAGRFVEPFLMTFDGE